MRWTLLSLLLLVFFIFHSKVKAQDPFRRAFFDCSRVNVAFCCTSRVRQFCPQQCSGIACGPAFYQNLFGGNLGSGRGFASSQQVPAGFGTEDSFSLSGSSFQGPGQAPAVPEFSTGNIAISGVNDGNTFSQIGDSEAPPPLPPVPSENLETQSPFPTLVTATPDEASENAWSTPVPSTAGLGVPAVKFGIVPVGEVTTGQPAAKRTPDPRVIPPPLGGELATIGDYDGDDREGEEVDVVAPSPTMPTQINPGNFGSISRRPISHQVEGKTGSSHPDAVFRSSIAEVPEVTSERPTHLFFAKTWKVSISPHTGSTPSSIVAQRFVAPIEESSFSIDSESIQAQKERWTKVGTVAALSKLMDKLVDGSTMGARDRKGRVKTPIAPPAGFTEFEEETEEVPSANGFGIVPYTGTPARTTTIPTRIVFVTATAPPLPTTAATTLLPLHLTPPPTPASTLPPPTAPPPPPEPQCGIAPNFIPCVDTAQASALLLQCCQAKGLPPGCQNLCRYDITQAEVKAAMDAGQCGIFNVAPFLECAAQGKNNLECCRGPQCEVFCNPAGGLGPLGLQHLPCGGVIGDLLHCHHSGVRI